MADHDEDQGDVELYDAEKLFRSLDGFECIALEQLFRTKLKALADDELVLMRALLVAVEKRAGMRDVDAFRKVMRLTLEQVTEQFERPADDAVEGEQDPDLQAQRDAEYADFVVGVGVSFMPDQYNRLTVGQRIALKDAALKAARP